jgi:hypothetical protein
MPARCIPNNAGLATGTAALNLEDDDTLRGEVVLGAQRFLLVLQR